MKRGNTALKRAVSVTSVAAMAIAGAVLAAPAANADLPAAAAAVVRAQPIANANQIGADGNKLAAPTGFTTTYSATGTGNVASVQAGLNNQAVSNLQIAIPGDASTTVWDATKSITVKLPQDVTFGSSTPTATFASSAVVTSSLGGTVSGTVDTVAGAVTSAKTIKATVSGDTLTLTPQANVVSAANVPSTDSVVVTVSGITVNVANTVATNYTASPGDNAVTATVTGNAALGITTLGYVNSFSLSAPGTYPAGAKSVALPNVSVTALAKSAFLQGAPVELTLTTDPAGSPTTASFDTTATATVTGPTGFAGTAAVTSPTTVKVTPTAPATPSFGSLTVSGLKVQNVPAGSKVVLTVSSPTGTADNGTAFSFTPDESANASISIGSATSLPRLAGDNRYDTAAKIAAAGSWSNNAVILANGTDVKQGVDALSANFLAGAVDSPILLASSAATLPDETVSALKALFNNSIGSAGKVTIYVMGKSDSVSDAAAAEAVKTVQGVVNSVVTNVSIQRVAGNNRYETSAASLTAGKDSLKAVSINGGTAAKTAILASGSVNADALAAGGLSAGDNIPVLLVDGDKVDASVSSAIKDNGITQLIVLGATDRIADSVIDGLKKDQGVTNSVRIFGTGSYGRYNTAALLNTFVFGASGLNLSLNNATAYLANGASGSKSGFADALSSGPLVGIANPLLTVPNDALPDLTKSFLTTNKGGIGDVIGLGQSDRIADSVLTAAQAAIQ